MLVVSLKGKTHGVDAGSPIAQICIAAGLVTRDTVNDPARVTTVNLEDAIGRPMRIKVPPPIHRVQDDPIQCIVCANRDRNTLREENFIGGLSGSEAQRAKWSLRDEIKEREEEGWEWVRTFPDDLWRLDGWHWICQGCLADLKALGELVDIDDENNSAQS